MSNLVSFAWKSTFDALVAELDSFQRWHPNIFEEVEQVFYMLCHSVIGSPIRNITVGEKIQKIIPFNEVLMHVNGLVEIIEIVSSKLRKESDVSNETCDIEWQLLRRSLELAYDRISEFKGSRRMSPYQNEVFASNEFAFEISQFESITNWVLGAYNSQHDFDDFMSAYVKLFVSVQGHSFESLDDFEEAYDCAYDSYVEIESAGDKNITLLAKSIVKCIEYKLNLYRWKVNCSISEEVEHLKANIVAKLSNTASGIAYSEFTNKFAANYRQVDLALSSLEYEEMVYLDRSGDRLLIKIMDNLSEPFEYVRSLSSDKVGIVT